MARTRPISFAIRPLDAGLNFSAPANKIEQNETPNSNNMRIRSGATLSRNGFTAKIKGVADTLLWLDFVYSATQTRLVAFGSKNMYANNQDELEILSAFDVLGDPLTEPISIEPLGSIISVDVGFGQYDFNGANAGNLFPSSDTYDTITFFSTGATNGIFALVYGVNGPEAEVVSSRGDMAPSSTRAVAVFADRLFFGGDEEDMARISWSAPGLLSNWDLSQGAGSLIIGDTPDWVQAMRRLGEYLIIYKERSIYIGRRTGMFDPPVRFEPAPGQGIGLASPNSIGDLGEEHIFLGWDNVYMFSLNRIIAVGDNIRDELFYGATGILPEYVENCTGVIAEEFTEYWLFVPTGNWPGDADGIENLVGNSLMAVPEEAFDSGQEYVDGETLDMTEVEGWSSTGTVYWREGKLGKSALESTNLSHSVTISSTNVHSIQVWLRSAENDGASQSSISVKSLGTEYKKIVDLETEFTLHTISFDGVAPGTYSLTIDSNTDYFVLDAIHLVVLPETANDFIRGVEGEQYIGYKTAFDTVVQIPLIADKVGPWLPDTCWVFNYKDNAWTRWRIPMTGFGYDSVEPIVTIADLEGTIEEQEWRFSDKAIIAFAPTNLLAQPDGQIYETNIGMSYDYMGVLRTPYPVSWESKDIDMDRPDIDKTITKTVIYHKVDHPTRTVYIGVSTDSGTTWEEQERTILEGTTQTVTNFIKTGNQMRLRIRSERAPIEFTGFGMRIVPRGEYNVYA